MVSIGHPAEAENEARIVQAKILREFTGNGKS
jgi:hypothetical protein